MVQLFSIVAMFIMFRVGASQMESNALFEAPVRLFLGFVQETLEACVVVAVMLNLCNKLNMQRMKRQVWAGVAGGVLVSVLIGVAFIIVFYVTKNSVFSGKGKSIFKGYVNLVASYLIAVLGFAMLRFMNYERKWERKLKAAHADSLQKRKKTGRGTTWAIFLLCFTAVFREGIEAVVFLAGVSTTEDVTAIPIAAVVGVLCGLVLGFALFFTGRQLKDLWWFFVLSFILLFMIASGLVSTGISAWQSIGWFGTFYPTIMQPWWNQPVWDTCGCCNDNITNNKFFGLMNAIFGYQCQPTFISLFSYCAFWFIICVCLFVKWRRGSLTDAEFKAKRREAKRRRKLRLPPLAEEEATLSANRVPDPKAGEETPRASSSTGGPSEFDSIEKAKLAATHGDPFTVANGATFKETELTERAEIKNTTL